MPERTDITDPEDIARLIDAFYSAARPDPVIGHFFTHLDWDTHIPKITSFWNMVLFGDTAFQGDPMGTHVQLDKEHRMDPAHFERWLLLFDATVDRLFQGPKAEEAKQRARTIAGVMHHKVSSARA